MSLPDPLPIQPLTFPFDLTIEDLPGSKSLTNRALLLAALADGKSTLTGVLFSDDSRVMLDALARLGFNLQIDESSRTVTITGQGGRLPVDSAELFLGNAGTATRFLTAACCLGQGPYTIDGIPRMRERPIGELVNPLRQLGANIQYNLNENCPPITISAESIASSSLSMAPTLSSQFISALLQIAPCLPEGLVINFKGPITSLPYVKMTLRLMQAFGAQIKHDSDYRSIKIIHTNSYQPQSLHIEPDASNASYFLAAAALSPGSHLKISGLGSDSLQGDVRFVNVLQEMGAAVSITPNTIDITGPPQLAGIDINLNDMPDMAQTLAVIALFAAGPTTIRDIGNLRVKETDRLAALHNELSKLGAAVEIAGDDLHIIPPRLPTDGAGGRNVLPEADIDTYDDHRMAMSFAVAALNSPGIRINDPACVNKTFPDFFQYLNRLR